MKNLMIMLTICITLASCSVTSVFPTDSLTKEVIGKDNDDHYYMVALEDGSTYYCTFGEYSLINVNDLIVFKSKRQNKIINILKPKCYELQ